MANNEQNQMDNLRKMNGILGFALTEMNVNYDDEDAELFDALLTAKVGDLPQFAHDTFAALISNAPEELKQMCVGELIDMLADWPKD